MNFYSNGNYGLNSNSNLFNSFWMAGFECSDKLDKNGNRVDFINITGHLQLIDEDYEQLLPFGITTVREGIRWSQVEKRAYQYDWSTVKFMIERAKMHGIQQVWDICHFGFPDDLSPMHPQFTNRFRALCKSFAEVYKACVPEKALIVIPINEVSFISWLGGEVGGTAPYAVRMGWEVKYELMRAFIQGVAAMREVDPSVRILTSEPLINMVPSVNPTEEDVLEALKYNEYQFQATDMLCGRLCPELGGKPEYLDIIGYNYYYNNQWMVGLTECLTWINHNRDHRWRPFSHLLVSAYSRYYKPMVVTETSHAGIHRPLWIRYMAEQCAQVIQMNIPLLGVCIYPILDRPDWDDLSDWHKSGLWDAELQPGQLPRRVLYMPYAKAMNDARGYIDSAFDQLNAFKMVRPSNYVLNT